MPYKLGKLPAVNDPRTLKLRRYVETAALPTLPNAVDWALKAGPWPMYANDQIGCCALAGPAHQVHAWTANDARAVVPTQEEVLAAYSKVSGWNPSDPNTDRGCVLLDVMRLWRHEGLYGQRIGAFASVDPRDHELTCGGIYLFGGLCVGLSLPAASQNMEHWTAPGRFHRRGEWAPGSWGGHCVEVVGYDANWLTCITWGAIKFMSWQFYELYCDEAFACISRAWVGPDSVAPNGFDAMALSRDLFNLKRE